MSRRVGGRTSGRPGAVALALHAGAAVGTVRTVSGIAAAQPVDGSTSGLPSFALPVATAGLVLFADIGLLAFAPEYGHGVLDTATENPPVTFVYGLGAQLGLFGVAVMIGVVALVPIVGWIVAFAASVPLFVVGVLGSTAGYVLVGRFLVGIVGPANVWLGLIVGIGLAVGVSLPPLIAGIPLWVAIAAFGFGGVVRRRLGDGSEGDRAVPDRRV